MKRFLAALGFLTTLPSGKAADTVTLGRSVPFFPLVGIGIGTLLSILYYGMFILGIPVVPGSIVLVMAWTMITGGLHLDGIADSADGMCSYRTRERMLEIMRDSRIGTMGALALIFIILLKIGCVVELYKNPVLLVRILLMAPVAGRSLQVSMLTWQPYARCEGGLAQIFVAKRRFWHAILSLFLLVIMCGGLMRGYGLVCAGVSLLIGLCFSMWCQKKIGGFTGDTLGGICEMGETAFLFAAVSMTPEGMGT